MCLPWLSLTVLSPIHPFVGMSGLPSSSSDISSSPSWSSRRVRSVTSSESSPEEAPWADWSSTTSSAGPGLADGKPGSCDNHTTAPYVVLVASLKDRSPGLRACPSIWRLYYLPWSVVVVIQPATSIERHLTSTCSPRICPALMERVASVMLGAAEIMYPLNGSKSTLISRLFARRQANVNSFSPALFQLTLSWAIPLLFGVPEDLSLHCQWGPLDRRVSSFVWCRCRTDSIFPDCPTQSQKGWLTGAPLCSKPYSRESLEVYLRPPDEVVREGEQLREAHWSLLTARGIQFCPSLYLCQCVFTIVLYLCFLKVFSWICYVANADLWSALWALYFCGDFICRCVYLCLFDCVWVCISARARACQRTSRRLTHCLQRTRMLALLLSRLALTGLPC